MDDKFTWGCVRHNPVIWLYGQLTDDGQRIRNLKAYVKRNKAGTWDWMIYSLREFGTEPNRIGAMKAAEKILIGQKGNTN